MRTWLKRLGIDWTGTGGCILSILKLCFLLWLLALATDSGNSDGTRIIAAIFAVYAGVAAREARIDEERQKERDWLTFRHKELIERLEWVANGVERLRRRN